MRINKFIAQSTGMSRRKADQAVEDGKVTINGRQAALGDAVDQNDTVSLNGRKIEPTHQKVTIMLNKPVGYVCSREGQGSKTIYDLLPKKYHHLKPVGRLDKDSSGLLLLTNDGDMAHKLTHPSHKKMKVYEVELNKLLEPADWGKITQKGVMLEDGLSKFELNWLNEETKDQGKQWLATLYEGRNRQIRRTFAAIGYDILRLHRIEFGEFNIKDLGISSVAKVKK